jgi:hypothetical protein
MTFQERGAFTDYKQNADILSSKIVRIDSAMIKKRKKTKI